MVTILSRQHIPLQQSAYNLIRWLESQYQVPVLVMKVQLLRYTGVLRKPTIWRNIDSIISIVLVLSDNQFYCRIAQEKFYIMSTTTYFTVWRYITQNFQDIQFRNYTITGPTCRANSCSRWVFDFGVGVGAAPPLFTGLGRSQIVTCKEWISQKGHRTFCKVKGVSELRNMMVTGDGNLVSFCQLVK